jgi:hypothetical protein
VEGLIKTKITVMTIHRIISSGNPGAESAALDVAIRFGIPYTGYTSQGSLMPGDRPPGRYRLDERPFVNAMLLMEANLAKADGLLIFAGSPIPERIDRLRAQAGETATPCLHMDTAITAPSRAAFRIEAWVSRHRITQIYITGSEIREDPRIYRKVHEAMTAFFMLIHGASAPHSQRTVH